MCSCELIAVMDTDDVSLPINLCPSHNQLNEQIVIFTSSILGIITAIGALENNSILDIDELMLKVADMEKLPSSLYHYSECG
jgi:hypothetical protein